jgi:hypothetical protein
MEGAMGDVVTGKGDDRRDEPIGSGRDETEGERLDRNLGELLGELRVALPGVQVLFAFLLVVPFNQRFTELTSSQEKIYYATLLCAAAASALLIAPTAHHRIEFRLQDKRYIVLVANRLTIAGLAFLALAVIGTIVVITDFLFSTTATVVASSLTAVAFAWLWFAMPIRRRMLQRSEQGPG